MSFKSIKKYKVNIVPICIMISMYVSPSFISAEEAAINQENSKQHIVTISNGSKVFEPESITIKAGETIKWVNNDFSIPLHMFASVPGSGESEEFEIEITTVKSGSTWEHTFNKKGEFPYFCFIHKGMIGKVIVTGK